MAIMRQSLTHMVGSSTPVESGDEKVRMTNYHASNLLLQLPALKTGKPLVAARRLGWEMELEFDDDDDDEGS